jgi:hypothetical protein
MEPIVVQWRLLKQMQSLRRVAWSAVDRYGVLFLPLWKKVARTKSASDEGQHPRIDPSPGSISLRSIFATLSHKVLGVVFPRDGS